MKLVSVIVPIYCVEKFLPKCIDSIINQTYKNIEIILVDDGSPDSCPAICDEYAKKDCRIIVKHKKNGGSVSARKAGILTAQGEYTIFVDGDDWISNDLIESVINTKEKSNAEVICYDFYLSGTENIICEKVIESGFYNREQLEKDILPFILSKKGIKKYSFGLYPSCWNKLYETEKIKQYFLDVPDTVSLGDDVAETFPYLLTIQSLQVMNRPLYFYRQNSDSMTHSYNSKQTSNTITLLEYLYEKLPLSEFRMSEQLAEYTLFLLCVNCANAGKCNSYKELLENYRMLKQYIKKFNVKEIIKKNNMTMFPAKYKIYFVMIKDNLFFLLVLLLFIRQKIRKLA